MLWRLVESSPPGGAVGFYAVIYVVGFRASTKVVPMMATMARDLLFLPDLDQRSLIASF
jgi:hypothetical protein